MPKELKDLDDVLTVKEVCEFLKVSRVTLFKWNKANYLKPHPMNSKRTLRYMKQDIAKLINYDNPLID